jgi:adenosylmethionine-8-amino-7-oxononanoate aminotransferase
MHGYTNAGHPTACAVALRNLQIFEDEGLVEQAARLGERLHRGLRSLASLSHVGDVRGIGLIAGIELAADKNSRTPFDPKENVGGRVLREMRQQGLLTRVKGDSILLAPPFVTTEAQIDRIVEVLGGSIKSVVGV